MKATQHRYPIHTHWSQEDGEWVATTPARAVVWSVDLRWRIFEKAQGGVGFGAVVVEAGV
jgi:hypothetical protein